ncbi:MAG: germination protein YpeB [Clostridia bacterium]|nr:germination protein YpeB [Clostridia bacterium]
MIEKFENKFNELKEKINPKVLGVATFMIFGAVLLFGMDMTNNFKRQKQQTEDSYNRAMYEMVGYVKNVEVELAKVQITATPRLTAQTFADIWRQANLAKENLDELPVEQNSMSNASKYLTQLSDYSYSLMKQTVSGEKISDNQYKDISQLYGQSKQLNDVLTSIYDDLNSGRLKWDELKKVGNQELPDSVSSGAVSNVNQIGKTFQQYEGLIYDGAFSDHLQNNTPKGVSEEEISEEQAADNLKKIFGEDEIEYIKSTGQSQGRVDLYTFEMKLKDKSNIYTAQITKKGGKLYLLLSDREVKEANISMDKAKQAGIEFLKKLGIENIKDTYYLTIENMAIINYAAVQDDVVIYPDLVKVKIALDTGEVCSAELQGYIFNHVKRDDIVPSISIDKAREILNKNINIQSQGLAIIPTDSNGEVLVYEFKGSIDERSFLIYVNAKTGEEEKVLLIIDTPGGILTM